MDLKGFLEDKAKSELTVITLYDAEIDCTTCPQRRESVEKMKEFSLGRFRAFQEALNFLNGVREYTDMS